MADRVLAFERVSSNSDSSDWTTSAGALSASATSTDGGSALAISGIGYAQLQSSPIGAIGTVGSNGSIDVQVPGTGTIAWGGVQLFVDLPSQGINNRSLPYASLQNLARGQFHSIVFDIDADTREKLSGGGYSDLVLRLAINVPNSDSPVLVDRLSLAAPISGSGGTSGAGAAASSAPAGSDQSTQGALAVADESSGPCALQPRTVTASDVEFFIKLPRGVKRDQIAIGVANGSLDINDGVSVMTAGGGYGVSVERGARFW
jgi:hypothetical protein